MSAESVFRGSVIRAIRARGVAAIAVEAGLGGVEAGTPDVAWARGWVELKVLRRWPARGGGVSIGLSREQLNWAMSWVAGGGTTAVMVRLPRLSRGHPDEKRAAYGWGRVALFNDRALIGLYTSVWRREEWLEQAVAVGSLAKVVEVLSCGS